MNLRRSASPSPTAAPFWLSPLRNLPGSLHDDGKIAWIAGRQDGTVSRTQLLAAGVSRHSVDRRIAHGGLRTVRRGVFIVAGAPVTQRGRWMTALLASPNGSAISHRSAAAVWGILPERPGPIHVTSPGPRQPVSGLSVHCSTGLAAVMTVRVGVPCTALPRTVVDIAGTEPIEPLRRAWSSGASRGLLRPEAFERELRAHPHRPGVATVRRLLTDHARLVRGHTRSELEAACLRLCQDHGVPAPKVNALVRLEGDVFEADLSWPEARLVAEIDAWRTHRHADAFRDDRARDFTFAAHGWRTVRLTEDAIFRRPHETAQGLRRILSESA